MKPFLPLSELKAGQWAVIDRFLEGATAALCLQLQELGFIQGRLLQIVRLAPWGGPIMLRIDDAFLALRRDEARFLQVHLA